LIKTHLWWDFINVRNLSTLENFPGLWEDTTAFLAEMNCLRQPHLVQFLTAFSQEHDKKPTNHYLLFEYATGGNLRDFWKTYQRPTLTSWLVKDVLLQLLGLTTAISAVRSIEADFFSGSHENLQPNNILWFPSKDNSAIGTFKIAGWEEQFVQTNRWWVNSHVDNVWPMGSIIFEFLIWLLYGKEGLNEAHGSLNDEYRQLYPREGAKPASASFSIPKAVEEYMVRMADDPACKLGTTALGDLLLLVRTRLLVIEPNTQSEGETSPPSSPTFGDSQFPQITITDCDGNTQQMTAPSTIGRADIDELQERLSRIITKGELSEDYWFPRTPRGDLLHPNFSH